MYKFIKWFNEITINDILLVGGKNASLGEMTQHLTKQGIKVPEGFAVTSEAYTLIIQSNHLEEKIHTLLAEVNSNDIKKLSEVGLKIRTLIRNASIPVELQEEIIRSYNELSRLKNVLDLDVAVRSSATAEDLLEASFAGQQETYLNIRGVNDLLIACRNCFASLFTDRAISYRLSRGFDHSRVKLSIGIQQMIRSDLASSGVMFTLDTESGARNVILINSAYGLGENVVGGRVDPDEFIIQKELLGKSYIPIIKRKLGNKEVRMVYTGEGERATKNIEVTEAERRKYSLSDSELMRLANWGKLIEAHYSKIHNLETPMDIEWAKDGNTGDLYILQARPETVHSNINKASIGTYRLKEKSEILLTGKAVGTKIGSGPVKIIRELSELQHFSQGDVLVAEMTDPDWEPVMKKASAIVTNRGGRTCHAAIISREHGVPCIVGTGSATETFNDHQKITVSCAEGDEGYIYEGILEYEIENIDWSKIPKTKTKIMINMAHPSMALSTSQLPVDGVGLTRMEFIISEFIRIHPMALVHYDQLKDILVRDQIRDILGSYAENPEMFFIDKLTEGLGLIAGAFFPRPVIIRFSDFKTNEYSQLLGGRQFEPIEENPMIGFRGASRYYDKLYREGFSLECKAIKKLREVLGLTNIKVMIPFCRSPLEGELVIREMKKNGLIQSQDGLEVYIMSEIPTNVLRAGEFAKIFDGFSIGSNDLTQMVLGVDRDSSRLSHLFNELDTSVLRLLQMAIREAIRSGRPIGICGQAPSDYPEFSAFLVKEGISSISVSVDAVHRCMQSILEAEKTMKEPYESLHV